MDWKTSKNFKIVLLSLCTTLITAATPNWFLRNLVGTVRYGYPFAWLVKAMVAPGVNPWSILPLWLCVDFIVWYLAYWVVFIGLIYGNVVSSMYRTGDI